MKIFAIKEKRGEKMEEVTYGWLYYDEEKKEFKIRLCRDVDYWNCPVFFASFVKNGNYELDSAWSRIWVQQRILSWERQNLQEILKENHMDVYDEYELLMDTKGRCGQDGCYLLPFLTI